MNDRIEDGTLAYTYHLAPGQEFPGATEQPETVSLRLPSPPPGATSQVCYRTYPYWAYPWWAPLWLRRRLPTWLRFRVPMTVEMGFEPLEIQEEL